MKLLNAIFDFIGTVVFVIILIPLVVLKMLGAAIIFLLVTAWIWAIPVAILIWAIK